MPQTADGLGGSLPRRSTRSSSCRACPPPCASPTSADSAVRPGCSSDGDITLIRRAIQRQPVMPSAGNPRSSRRSDDGQTILRPVRTGPDLYADLAFRSGSGGGIWTCDLWVISPGGTVQPGL